MTVVKHDWFRNIVSCKCWIQFRNSCFLVLILVGIFLIFKLETMRVFGYLWSEGVVWLREKQRQNRTMTLQHPPPPAEAAAKAIWPSPESLCILISSKTRVITRLPWMRGMRLVQRPCCCSVLLRDNTGLWGLCFLTDDALLLCLAPARCRTSVA